MAKRITLLQRFFTTGHSEKSFFETSFLLIAEESERKSRMRSYRPKYHASVLSGWSNDPNGTIYYNGRAHLFFQHYPYKAEWGTMHWGHFATDDFVKWDTLPVALVPDQDYEAVCGCCSGSTIEEDGDLWVMYTAAQPERQRQCLAVSRDGGIRFVKRKDNPILTSGMLDPEVTESDFRDPRLFRKDGYYYFIAGARVRTKEEMAVLREEAGKAGISAEEYLEKKIREEVEKAGRAFNPREEVRSPSARSFSAGSFGPSSAEFVSGGEFRPPSAGPVSDSDSGPEDKDGFGNLILVKGRDLRHWEYVGHLLDRDTAGQIPLPDEFFCLNGVFECPDYIELDGQEVVLTSPQNLPQVGNSYQNVHSGIYLMGEQDFETGRFRVDQTGELDYGFDFYAAQSLRMPDGRVIMIAWKEMWDRNFPTQKEGWAGTYTLPRELFVIDGAFIQKPVRELEKYRRNKISAESLEVTDGSESVAEICGNVIELQAVLEPGSAAQAGLKLFCGSEHETLVYYDREKGQIIFDRSRSGIPFSGQEKDVDRRVCVLDPADRSDSIELQLFLDVNSLEVFINGGRYVMTGNVYPDPEDTGVQFFAEGGSCTFRNIVKFDIVV